MVDGASRKKSLAKLEGFNDPLRIAIVTVLFRKPASAKDLAAELDVPIGRVRYQLGRLRKAGLAELQGQRQRRGVFERVYSLRPNFLWADEMEHLTEDEMVRAHLELLKAMFADSVAALQSGSLFFQPDYVAARVPLRLDAEGWEEAAELQRSTLKRLTEIHAEASVRIEATDGGRVLDAMAFLLLFEEAPSQGRKKLKKI